jgi:hypothetical protein
MSVSSVVEKDALNDEILGPHKHMHCVMARGLFSKWKQLVYVDFDVQMTRETLEDLMKSLYDVNYQVVACVSDCGGGNQGLWWQKIGITEKNTFMLHPSNQEKVFFFADAPHLLKLFRNWLLDTGFVLEDGKNMRINYKKIINSIILTISVLFLLQVELSPDFI